MNKLFITKMFALSAVSLTLASCDNKSYSPPPKLEAFVIEAAEEAIEQVVEEATGSEFEVEINRVSEK